jgi:hypothetical protein
MKSKLNKEKILKISLVFFILLFLFIKTYSIHFDYKYPMHIDEWQHLALAKQIQKEGIVEKNPYFQETKAHLDLEPVFHLFLAGLMFIDVNLILHYQYLPAIFACISALLLFILIYRTTKNYWIGLFSMIFFAGIRSSVNILGLKFFTPLTMALPLIFLFFICYIDSINKKDNAKFIISIFILLIIFFIHPPSAIILIPAIIFELIYNVDFLKKKHKLIATVFAVLIGIIAIFAFYLFSRRDANPTQFFSLIKELLLFRQGFTSVEIKYFFPLLYGIVPLALAFIGIFDKEQYDKKRIWIATSAICILLIFIYNNYKFSTLAPYQRVLYYAMVALVPLSAFGLYRIMEFVQKKTKREYQKNIFIISILILVLALSFTQKYEIVDTKQVYNEKVIYDEDYKAMLWFKENYGNYNKVIAPIFMSSAVYPLTSNYVVSVVPAQLDGGDLEANIEFYNTNTSCNRKKEIIDSKKVDYVFSRKDIECSFLEEIYNDNFFIYKAKDNIEVNNIEKRERSYLFSIIIILLEISIIAYYIHYLSKKRRKHK